ncbi:MAG: YceI family protein [Bacteroidota bacterium]
MNKIKTLILLAALLTAVQWLKAQPMSWNISNDYTIKFSGKKVDGFFRGLDVDIVFDENNPAASKIVAGVNANTLNTGTGLKNKHAKSKKGIDAKRFGMITFASRQIVKKGNAYEATGILTIKGMSNEIKLPFTFERIETDAVFKGKFSIKPRDYQVTRHGTPETIDIDLVVRVTTK